MFVYDRFERLRKQYGVTKSFIATAIERTPTVCQDWKKGKSEPNDNQIVVVAEILHTTPEYLRGETDDELPVPVITDNYVTFSVIGDVAAGFDHIAYEDWVGDTIDVPASWLRGRERSEFFALRVCGDSMYPLYQDGDVVLVLRQSTMNRSGQIGVVMYDDDKATLKRVEYADGEDWMKLSPVNPNYPPITVRDEMLEHCRVLGIPKYLVREIGD